MPMILGLITEQIALEDLCVMLRNAPYLALDTEFIREKSYWPQLCLIQVGTREGAWLIDPLADGLHLEPLWELIHQPNIIKVFHAAKQDVEIIVKATGRVPMPIFDTQIAALALGYDEQQAFDKLVESFLGVHLSKAQRFTDWARRPLSEAQQRYALNDVVYLAPMYEKILEALKVQGRETWLQEEWAALDDVNLYYPDPARAWEKIKFRSKDPYAWACLQAIAAWRERTAQRRDMPRLWVMKDEAITALAELQPTSTLALSEMRTLPPSLRRNDDGETLVKMIADIRTQPAPPIPAQEHRAPKANQTVMQLLDMLLRVMADEARVNPRLLATHDQLSAFARGGNVKECFPGWRYELFGAKAEAMRRGELSLGLQGTKAVWRNAA